MEPLERWERCRGMRRGMHMRGLNIMKSRSRIIRKKRRMGVVGVAAIAAIAAAAVRSEGL